MIKGLAHICFMVSDLDVSLSFYCEKLGLTPAFDFINDQGKRFGVYLKIGNRNFLELFQTTDPLSNKPTSYNHFCLEVDDIEATARGLELTEVFLADDFTYQSWLTDPDGNKIELHQYTKKSKQAPHLQ